LAILLLGCKNEAKDVVTKEENYKGDLVNREVVKNTSIKVEENISLGYKELRVIDDAQELQQLEAILVRLAWEKAKVEMSFPPHFRFITEDVFFAMWVTPNS
jgi:hypothetical protein